MGSWLDGLLGGLCAGLSLCQIRCWALMDSYLHLPFGDWTGCFGLICQPSENVLCPHVISLQGVNCMLPSPHPCLADRYKGAEPFLTL